MTAPLFPPTLEAAQARIAAVRPADYARSRNAIEGAVTRLSPYVTHGFVDLPEVLRGVLQRHPQLPVQHKFVFELGWREYFRHQWQHRGEGILQSLHEGSLPDAAYASEMPADIRQARTGVPVVDEAVRTLYATGYLHNHARMWLASYVVHLRKLHWRAGADWMLGHLLDGDLASNHLSWQWVAGTASHKPYLFNAGNVARFAPAAWHSEGSVVDADYATLEAMARSPAPVPARPVGDGVDEPAFASDVAGAHPPRADDVAGQDVWLVHPWSLGEPPAGHRVVAWWPAEVLSTWPWSSARRAFVGTRMAALASTQWHGDGPALAQALATARSVQTLDDPHVAPLLPPTVHRRPAPRLFALQERPCPSFSTWWTRATRGLKLAAELPGLAGG